MSILDHAPTKGNLGPIGLRTTLATILGNPRLSDRAKRIAQYLDSCCLAGWQWAAWPKVSTIADALGWESEYGARKRVERGIRELVAAGLLRRMTVAELAEWFDTVGHAQGLQWPARLKRVYKRSMVCVLEWKVSAASPSLPILPRCDTNVASSPPADPSSVACDATPESHQDTTQVSHASFNVRNLNVQSEQTSDDRSASAPGDQEETATMEVAPIDQARWNRADRLLRRFNGASLEVHPDGSLDVLATHRAFVPPPSDEDRAELAELWAEVQSIRWPEKNRRSSVRPAESPAASPVPNSVQSDIRSRIRELSELRSHSECVGLAIALVKALGPHQDEDRTRGTFYSYVKTLEPGKLARAFEEACGRKKNHRGKAFVDAVKRLCPIESRESSPAR